jgi:methionyl-tRNA formyltransferase
MSNSKIYNIVLLTNGSDHAIRILNGLKERGIMIDAVVHQGLELFSVPKEGRSILGLVRHARNWLRQIWKLEHYESQFLGLSKKFVMTGTLNGRRMWNDLKRLDPDFIILAGMGIITDHIINTARIGVINAHPALLPWLRNVGVVGNALCRNIPVGITCHYVNAGIDLGDIIERRLLPITGEEQSLNDLEVGANKLCSKLMVDILANQIYQGIVPLSFHQIERYPPCQWLSQAERSQVDQQIAEGKAKLLFEQWNSRICSATLGVLPANCEPPVNSLLKTTHKSCLS